MSNNNQCVNCTSLTQQCIELKEEIKLLTQKLDNLLSVVFRDKKNIACQSVPIIHSASTQTESVPIISSVSTQTENLNEPLQVSCITTETQRSYQNIEGTLDLSFNCQNNMLLDIFLKSSEAHLVNQSKTEDSSYATPLVVLPYVNLPNKPFSQFNIDCLDKCTVFDTNLPNRSLCYYGNFRYSYTSIEHKPKPIPDSDNYLCSILDHLHSVLPDYKYNSILLTKYSNGKDGLGFHSDNESEIEPQSDIVTISLGESRVAKFRGLRDECPEQSLIVNHGDCFIMSRSSQNFFQHSITTDSSQNPRISITLRLLKPTISVSTNMITHHESSHPPLALSANVVPQDDHTDIMDSTQSYTLYIGDSMFRHLNSNKMSSVSQKAFVFSYPGASVNGVLSKIKSDQAFLNINPSKVKKVYVFCGANNVDQALQIPFSLNSDGIDLGRYNAPDSAIQNVTSDFLELTNFIHSWASAATINILNVLPRVSAVRNSVINCFNQNIKQLSQEHSYINMVTTELHRSLFSYPNGHRKSNFFSDRGDDNVHLNSLGIARLSKYLKYFAHN